jgi:hypothetical protein
MLERGDTLDAAIGDGRALVALGRRLPVELAMETVVVVVGGEAGQPLVRGLRRGEQLARA